MSQLIPNDSANFPNVETAWTFFSMKGMGEAAIAACIGNNQQESFPRMDPTTRQGNNGPGRGICQWVIPPHGSRFTNLERFAAERGTTWEDLTTQLEFMWRELNTSDIDQRMKGVANWNDGGAYMRSLERVGAKPLKNGFKDFMKMKNVAEATILLEAVFFRSGGSRNDRRVAFAEAVIDRFGTKKLTKKEKEKLAADPPVFQIGSKVRIKPGSNWLIIPPRPVPAWALPAIYRIDALVDKRAVLNTDGINSPISIDDLELIG